MIQRQMTWFGRSATLACDGECHKAWGITQRPHIAFDPANPDDIAWLSDSEAGAAPAEPGTYEGGDAKPRSPQERLNKWCARECERSRIAEAGEAIELPDYTKRRFNQPWKHFTDPTASAG